MWLRSFAFLIIVATFASARVVNLTFHGLTNEQFFMEIQNKIGLWDVTVLNLRGNKFDTFIDCATDMSALRNLDLSQNYLKRIFFLCKDEYKLEILNVSYNSLEYIDEAAFNDRTPQLKILDLSHNKLMIVNETMLEHFTILQYLSLSHNPIGSGVHENAFWTLKGLKHLDMRNISAPFFSPDQFKTLTNLSVLDLSWNPIETVPILPFNLEELDLSGTQVTGLENLYLPQLIELKLNHMPNLTSLTLNDLNNLTRLEKLSMIGCRRLVQLNLLPQNSVMLPRLQRLSIKENSLGTLGVEMRALMLRIPVVELQNNLWKCDCKLEWIATLNTIDKRKLTTDVRCHAPDRHHGKLLAEIPSYEMQCESYIYYTVLGTCLSISIIALILVTGFILFRRPMGLQWAFRSRNRDSVTYKTVVESNNDMVRILAMSETHDCREE